MSFTSFKSFSKRNNWLLVYVIAFFSTRPSFNSLQHNTTFHYYYSFPLLCILINHTHTHTHTITTFFFYFSLFSTSFSTFYIQFLNFSMGLWFLYFFFFMSKPYHRRFWKKVYIQLFLFNYLPIYRISFLMIKKGFYFIENIYCDNYWF